MQKTFSLSTDDLDDKWVVSQYRAHHTAERLSNTSRLDFESLGEVSRITSGSYVRDYAPEGTPYIRVDNVRHHVFNLTEEDLEYLPKYEVDDLTDRCFCQTDDIIISRTGTLGKAVLVLQPQSGMALSQHTTRIIADKSSVLPAYLCLYLNSPTGSTALDNLGAGSTRSELTHTELEKLQLPVAPTHVQEEYGQRLRDALENYYESVSNLRSLYREVDRFLGHHESGAEEPIAYDIGYDELGDLWNPSLYQPEMIRSYKEVISNFDTIEIGNFAEVSRGKGTKTEEYSEEGFPFLRTSSLINGSVDPFPDHYADDKVYSRFDQPIEDGDILFSIEGKIGQSAMLMERMQVVFKNHIEIIRTREVPPHLTFSEMTGWVLAVLNSKYGEGLVDMNSVVQSTISGLASRLRSFPIPISPKDGRSVDRIKSIGNRVFEESGSLIDSLIKLQGTQESFNEYLKSNGID